MEKTWPLLTVIVPVYRVEKYLDRCLDSLAVQTYKNIEIILVDDGSPDRCPEICEKRAVEDSRFRCIHKENAGLSAARNTGLEYAHGDYIAFIDSDDWVEPETYETAIDEAEKTGAEVVQWNAMDEYENGLILKWPALSEGKADIKKDPAVLRNNVWNYVLRRSFIDRCNLRFKPGIYIQDVLFTSMLFLNTDKIYSINRYFYHYLVRDSSITNAPETQSKRRADSIFVTGEIEKAAAAAGRLDEFTPVLNAIKADIKRTWLWKTDPPDFDKFRDTFPEADTQMKWNSTGLRLLRFLIYSKHDTAARLLMLAYRILKKTKKWLSRKKDI